MSSFLKIMKDRGYIKNFQVYDPHRVGRITVELQGRINDCRALTYRQDIKARDIEGYRVRMLPTHQWGYVVITTPDGVLDHEDAIKKECEWTGSGLFPLDPNLVYFNSLPWKDGKSCSICNSLPTQARIVCYLPSNSVSKFFMYR